MSAQDYYNPVELVEGVGVFDKICDEFVDENVALITTKGTRQRGLDDFIDSFDLKVFSIHDSCIENPTFTACRALYEGIDFDNVTKILAIGGGSVIDAAKAVSVYDSSKSFESVENAVRQSEALSDFDFVPIVAVPTTAGTGSELTCWGTIWDDVALKKFSISDPSLYPVKAYCDPLLTLSLPLSTTLSTALDALSHSFESIWNNNASERTQEYAIASIELILENIVPLSNDLTNVELRSNIMSAASNAGLAFSNTKTSVAHALSYYLTLNKGIPHGMACSFTLPHILKVYLEEHGDNVLNEGHLARIKNVFASLDISTDPRDYGILKDEFDKFFEAGTKSERMKNSLVNLSELHKELSVNY